MALLESGEMYLETILVLSQKQPQVRSIDIADHMKFSKPSVSRAIHILKDSGYIDMDQNGLITLLEPGRKVAESIYDRHNTLTKALMYLGVNEETATDDACRIEHYISEDSFQAIKKHLKEMKKL